MHSPPLETELVVARQPASMAIPRAVYFFYFGAAGLLIPYLALYYKELGFSGSQIGLLSAIPPLVSLVSAPAWGALADATGWHKRILLLAMGLSALSVAGLAAIHNFIALGAAVAFYACVTAPIIPLVDNTVIQQLGLRRDEYGKQRVWGSYGWGVVGLASGWIVAQFGLQAIFVGYAILMLCGLSIAWRIAIKPTPSVTRVRGNFRRLFFNRQWLLFLGLVWIAGAGVAMVSNYYFIYLQGIGTSPQLFGIAIGLGILSEIPVMLYSDRLLKRFGALGMLGIGVLVFASRALLFSVATQPWQAIVLQIVHGLTFPIMWIAGVEFASQSAPAGMGATSQGMFGGIFGGLGFASGALVGGVVYERNGISSMYRLAALGTLIALALFRLLSREAQSGRRPINSEE